MSGRRVVESFPLYDTVVISSAIDESNNLGFFNNYAQMGNQNKITFFDQRKQTDTDLAYCNLDAKERFPYGYTAYSFGISFQGPAVGSIATIPGEPTTVAEMVFGRWSEEQLFNFELPKHCGVRVKLEQNDVLESNVMFSPAGTGAFGQSNIGGSPTSPSDYAYNPHVSGMTGGFGIPQMTNRFPFPEPLVIPTNSVFSIELEFSQMGKELLKAMQGPSDWVMGEVVDGDPPLVIPHSTPAMGMIQVSLMGTRYVQQRGEETAQVPGV
jgi:hypothetical protein